jgi:polysaccharide export outer membrane protein
VIRSRTSFSVSMLVLGSLALCSCARTTTRTAAAARQEPVSAGDTIEGASSPAAGNGLLQEVAVKRRADGAEAARPTDQERLRQLAEARQRREPVAGYTIGPGDLLDVRVFNLPEMTRTVRVAANGSIQLPLIGIVQAEGNTAEELSAKVMAILATNLVRHPQVDVFVTENTSQRVAVTGAVFKPGLYSLTREHYTILDVISEAGGLTKEAGSLVDFIPAEDGGNSAAFQVASTGAKLPIDAQNATGHSSRPIHIDLNELFAGGNVVALNLPVTAGDVVYVPEAGSFTIEGWVDKPGTYPLVHDTTVLAALSMGGGPLLPARLRKVEILRSSRGATSAREAQVVDLEGIRAGDASDVALRSGDIVRVPGSAPLIVPWGIYSFVKSLISIGASIPVL